MLLKVLLETKHKISTSRPS